MIFQSTFEVSVCSQMTGLANRAPIAEETSYKMAQAIFEVLEGKKKVLLTAHLQRFPTAALHRDTFVMQAVR